jgi:hypothetical protein
MGKVNKKANKDLYPPKKPILHGYSFPQTTKKGRKLP